MRKADFRALHKMIEFMKGDLRHCIGADANWVVALALVTYTEVFGHFLLPKGNNPDCFNRFLSEWMKYPHLVDKNNPGDLYDRVRNGLVHEYLIKKSSSVINMGTGPCGIEIIKGRKGETVRLNLVTYYNDFMEAVKEYERKIKTDPLLQKAYDQRMTGKQRLE